MSNVGDCLSWLRKKIDNAKPHHRCCIDFQRSGGSWVVLLMLPLNVLVYTHTDSQTDKSVLLDISCRIRKQEGSRDTSAIVWNDSSGKTHAPGMVPSTAPVLAVLLRENPHIVLTENASF